MASDTALALRERLDAVESHELLPLINVAAKKQRLDNFREFVATCLDKSKGHYNTIPGTNKDSLLQPGAEVIAAGLEVYPDPEVIHEEIKWDEDFCYFHVKVVIRTQGSNIIVGAGTGACSSLEYSSKCPTTMPMQDDGSVTINCPQHGNGLSGKRGWRWGNKRGEKVWDIVECPKRVPQPLSQTLQTVQAMASKRAFVAAIRTVGCVSELFTQDDELWANKGKAEPEAAPAAERPTTHEWEAELRAELAEADLQMSDLAFVLGVEKVTARAISAYLEDHSIINLISATLAHLGRLQDVDEGVDPDLPF